MGKIFILAAAMLCTPWPNNGAITTVNISASMQYFSQQAVSGDKGRVACRNLGAEWDLPDGQFQLQTLVAFLQKNKIHAVWLSLKRKLYEEWTWVNGITAPPGTLYEDGGVQQRCGGVSLQHQNLRSMSCAEWRNGFVCQMPENATCPEKYFSQVCRKISRIWYIIGCKTQNWQDARSLCRRKGGDLAIVDTEHVLNEIILHITERKLADHCSWLFVGIRKEEWGPMRNHTDKPAYETYWGTGEPASGNDCVYLGREADGYRWRTSPCHKQLPLICQEYAASLEKNQLCSPTQSSQSQGNTFYNKSLVLAGTVILFVGTTVLCLVFLCVFRNRKLLQKVRMAKRDEEEEEILLSSKEKGQTHIKVDHFPPIQSEADKVTIIIFSNGLKFSSDHIEYLNIPKANKHKNGEGNNAAKLIEEECKEFLSKTPNGMDKIKFKIRIINIVALDRHCQLGRAAALNMLDYLCTQKESIDVIYMPGIKIPVSSAILKKLKELRESCILMCYARNKSTEMPSSEAIAINVSQHDSSLIFSGILDIRVQVEEEVFDQTNVNPSVARTVGFVTGMLLHAKQSNADAYPVLKNSGFLRKVLIDLCRWQERTDRVGFGELRLDDEIRKKAVQAVLELTKEKYDGKHFSNNFPEKLQTTRENLTEALIALEVKEGPPIVVAIASSPIVETKSSNNGIKIETRSKYSTDLAFHGDIFTKELIKVLSSLRLPEEAVHIVSVPTRVDDTDPHSDWSKYNLALSRIMEELEADVVYISSDLHCPPHGQGIKRLVRALKRRTVLLTGAKPLGQLAAPCCYPGDSVITVGRQHGPQGALIDFISTTPQQDTPARHDTLSEAWVAAVDAVCAIVAIMIKARQLGIEDLIRTNKQRTVTMRHILLHMCSNYVRQKRNTVEEGYGVLQPSVLLGNDEVFKNVVEHYTGDQAPGNYWSGKNI